LQRRSSILVHLSLALRIATFSEEIEHIVAAVDRVEGSALRHLVEQRRLSVVVSVPRFDPESAAMAARGNRVAH
jgi:hypothetical protein